MQISRISYRREDILHFKNVSSDINGLDIADHSLLYNLSLPTHNGSIVKQKTKRGNRAGKRRKYTKLHSKRPSIDYSTKRKPNHLIPIPKYRTIPRSSFLPTILYTNCRSINTWKLAELQTYVEIHKPNLICLTETWLDATKQQLIQIDGYDNHFSHRKSRIGGGYAYSPRLASAPRLYLHTLAGQFRQCGS